MPKTILKLKSEIRSESYSKISVKYMQNLAKRLNRVVNALRSLKNRKMIGRWSFLFVKEDGEIISIDRFKELVITLAVVMIVMLIATASFYLLYKSKTDDHRRLQKELETYKDKLAALQDEKDVLMVRLVLAESKAKDGKSALREDITEQSIETLSKEGDTEKASASVNSNKKTLGLSKNPRTPKQVAVSVDSGNTAPDIVKSENLTTVDVEDLDVFHDAHKNSLIVKFILRKTDSNTKTVSGRAFVVLKSDEGDEDPFVLPSVPLASGRPTQVKRGQYFSIAHFKWMKFERKNQPHAKPLKHVTVFIFASSGELLLKKDFAL